MSQETVQLAEYAANLRFEDLPATVVQRAKDCIADTVAVIYAGQQPAMEPDRGLLCTAVRGRWEQPHSRD